MRADCRAAAQRSDSARLFSVSLRAFSCSPRSGRSPRINVSPVSSAMPVGGRSRKSDRRCRSGQQPVRRRAYERNEHAACADGGHLQSHARRGVARHEGRAGALGVDRSSEQIVSPQAHTAAPAKSVRGRAKASTGMNHRAGPGLAAAVGLLAVPGACKFCRLCSSLVAGPRPDRVSS
jgi:hypothetical protein